MKVLMTEMPSAHVVEPEFLTPPTRLLPAFVYRGRYLQAQRKAQRGLLVAAALCAGAQFLPVIQQWAVYVLPLGYVGWIAVALMIAYLVSVLHVLRGQGILRYLTEGEALPIQVLGLTKQPSVVVNGQESQFAFVVTAQTHHPDTGELVTVEIHSDNYSVYEKARCSTTLRVGDTATALYLPGAFDTSLKLYGFLGLNPDVDYIRGAGRSRSLQETAAIALAVVITVALVLSLYTMERYGPLEFPVNGRTLFMAIAGALVGLAAVALGYVMQRRAARDQDARNMAAVAQGDALEVGVPQGGRWRTLERVVYAGALVVGIPLLSAIIAVCGVLFVNGYLDRSAPTTVPVEIGERHTETHALVFRQYKVNYTLAGEEKERILSTSPGHLQRLGDYVAGVAFVRAGYFGWPWIQTIEASGLHGNLAPGAV